MLSKENIMNFMFGLDNLFLSLVTDYKIFSNENIPTCVFSIKISYIFLQS